jgi:hypothetical protein
MSSQKQSTNNNNNKKVVVQPERKLFQFSEFKEEEPVKVENLVVEPEKKKMTGPWSDDLIEDVDDPSWTTVTRKKRKTK